MSVECDETRYEGDQLTMLYPEKPRRLQKVFSHTGSKTDEPIMRSEKVVGLACLSYFSSPSLVDLYSY